jgi:GPH family glycoside/pentoside/hexuronide:cation symporter
MPAQQLTTPSLPSARLPRRTKLIFGLGDWGPTTAGTAIMFFFAFFLTDVARLAPAYASLVLLVGGLWDAINDPIVGILADRVRTRWGRRRPFFLFGAAPFALALIALWWTPPWEAPLAKMAYYMVAYLVWDTAFTLVSIPYAALTPELTGDYDERSRLNGYRMVVSMVGGLIAAIAVPVAAGLFPEPKTGYLLMAVIFGALGAIPFLLLFFGIRERPPAPDEVRSGAGGGLGWGAWASIFRNRSFRYAAGIYLTSWVTVGLVAALFQYYLTYPMQMPGEVEIVLGLLQASALAFTAAAVWLATRLGKQQTYIMGVLWLSAIVIPLTFLQPGAQVVVFALALLAGFGVAIAQVIPWAIVPDVIDADELATGLRREATYYGVLTFAQKGGTALALALMQGVLAFTGYVAGAQQPESALLAIRLMIGPIPAVLLLFSALLAWRYPLTRQRHAALRAELTARREVR